MKKNSSPSVRNFLRATRGANMVEYVILVGLVALMCIVAYTMFGDSMKDRIKAQATTVKGVNAGTGN